MQTVPRLPQVVHGEVSKEAKAVREQAAQNHATLLATARGAAVGDEAPRDEVVRGAEQDVGEVEGHGVVSCPSVRRLTKEVEQPVIRGALTD